MLILVTGKTGAGKTTHSKSYMSNNAAKLYSIDSWMKSLYWQDMPDEPDMKWFVDNQQWYVDRILRCEELIKNEIRQLLESKCELDILLDLGFTSSTHRLQYINIAKEYERKVQIHYLDVEKDKRWKRVEDRNNSKPETYTMNVTKDMFEYIEEIFESFSDEELAHLKTFHS